MTEQDGIYKCEVCGNVVSVVEAHKGVLVCCGQDMKLLVAKTEEEGNEKHVPVVEILEGKVKVTVSSVLHPMEEDHFIEFIRLVQNGKVIAGKRLYPGQEPVVEFCLESAEGVIALEYCNIHGLWKSK